MSILFFILTIAVSNTLTWYLERKRFNEKIDHIQKLYDNALEIFKKEGKQLL